MRRLSCPACGKGPLYRGWLAVRHRCSCGADLGKLKVDDATAAFSGFFMTLVGIMVALWLDSRWSPPLWLLALVMGLFIVIVGCLVIRFVKAYFLWIAYRHAIYEDEA